MKLPTVKRITLEIDNGSKIYDACKDAVLMTQRLNCPVHFEFNSRVIIAVPGDSVRDLADAWWKSKDSVAVGYFKPTISTGRVPGKELKTKKTKKEKPKEVERPTRRIIL
jgi:hypothetical protein